jgi:hypothetical protein
MTRRYADVPTSIWDDDGRPQGFRRRSRYAKLTLLMLKTQRNISAAGVLPITLPRWANILGGEDDPVTVDDVAADLRERARSGDVVIDETTSELLVVDFVYEDKGYGNPKRLPVIQRASREIESPPLRAALAVEFEHLGLTYAHLVPARALPGASGTDSQADSLSGSPADTHNQVYDDRTMGDPPDQVKDQVNSLSGTHAGRHGPEEGVVVSTSPQPTTHNPQPSPPPNGTHARMLTAHATRAERGELAGQVQEIRTDWSGLAILRALEHPDVEARPWAIVCAAFIRCARDETTKAPGRLHWELGPWWAGAVRDVQAVERRLTPRDWRGPEPDPDPGTQPPPPPHPFDAGPVPYPKQHPLGPMCVHPGCTGRRADDPLHTPARLYAVA